MALWRLRQEDHKFETSQGYLSSSRSTWALWWDPISKKWNKTKQNNNKRTYSFKLILKINKCLQWTLHIGYLKYKNFIHNFFGGTRIWTQDFACTKQVLCCLRHTFSKFLFWLFLEMRYHELLAHSGLEPQISVH
jgi:hypothetical protein